MALLRPRAALFALALAGLPAALSAQGTEVMLGGLEHDTTQAVEVSADRLTVEQATGTSVFSGGVVVGQGEMRLSAETVRIEYREGAADGATGERQQGAIARMLASGGVTLVTGSAAAEAQEAEYSIDSGRIVMEGDVLLTQGGNALSGDRLIVDLTEGTGTMEGRVRTIIQPDGNQ